MSLRTKLKMAGNFDRLHEEELIMILKLVKNKKALYLTCTRLNELCLQIDNKAKICGLVITSPQTVSSLVRIIYSYILILY